MKVYYILKIDKKLFWFEKIMEKGEVFKLNYEICIE